MKLLLRVKNGTPPMRKAALRQLTQSARDFGAGPLFNQILPLLMSPTLEDQERHLLVKVIDRILYKLDDLVRPYVHKILVVIEPLLIDEDYYARVEGREIISNLAKAAGLATMIAEYHCSGIRCGCFCSWYSFFASFLKSCLRKQKELGGSAYWYQDCPANFQFDGMCCTSSVDQSCEYY